MEINLEILLNLLTGKTLCGINKFMNALKFYRQDQDMYAVDLADAVGVHKSYISQIESGHTVAKCYAKLIADELGLSLRKVFEPAERKGRYQARKLKIKVVK